MLSDGRVSTSGDPLEIIRHEFGAEYGFQRAGADLAGGEPGSTDDVSAVDYPARRESNRSALRRNHTAILAAASGNHLITPAAEWLLDNHYVVDESFRHLSRDLVPAFYHKLPHVVTDGGGRMPAALAFAWRYVALGNSEFNVQSLTDMVEGYQSVRPFKIGELWAIPAMLRYVMLENLRRISDQVTVAHSDRAAANALADRLMRGDPEALSRIGAGPLSHIFAAQLLYRLRDGSDEADAALADLEAALERQGTDSARLLNHALSRQSTANVAVGNVIQSMRRLDETNWVEWVEKVSQVDAILNQSTEFPRLDRATRNDYRNRVEQVARRSELSEIEVARTAVRLAREEPVGHLLVGREKSALEEACGYDPHWREKLLRTWRSGGWKGIFGPAALIMVAIAVATVSLVAEALPLPFVIFLFGLSLLTASEAAMGLVHLVAVKFVPPSRLPAFDYADGIPEEARTLVAVPCLISDQDTVDDMVGLLELHYLSNPDDAVDFALVTDWPDSPVERSEVDDRILEHARTEMDRLSRRYSHVGSRFFLLHRARIWNAVEGTWMGWERKRGKLAELNALLLGAGETTFVGTASDYPRDIKFVVTLDSDTRLPRGTIAALVGKMMHPVNRATTDPASGLVTEGHSLLQPRVTPSLTTGANSSVFQTVFSAGRGIDPYVFTVSDLYQDLLDEGSFTGKGIYEVAAFDAAMADRFPENTVLSHDLIEGALGRAALVTDVQFVEDYPVRYDVDVARQHRWIRGDWQLLPFIADARNGLNGLARLKMLDNLRRSLVAPAWVLSSVTGWFLLPAPAAWLWQTILFVTMFFMPILNFLLGMMPSQPGIAKSRHARRVLQELGEITSEIALRLVFIAHQACNATDAIARTLWRLTVSRRHLLEWRTAQQVSASGSLSRRDWWVRMIGSPIIGGLAFGLTLLLNPEAWQPAALLSALWILAPAIAFSVSQTLETEDRLKVSPEEAGHLRRIARMTWRYFEDFVTAESNHLPPDNYQDTPEPKLAERTSPTNIGLYLLSVLSARDMGWITQPNALARIERTIRTVESMDRHRGHLYNWYDTRTLNVLEPRYISAVDNGNLAGHLIALATALEELAINPAAQSHGNLAGVGDTLGVLTERLSRVPDTRRVLRPLRRRLEQLIEGFRRSHIAYMEEPQLASLRALNLTLIASDIGRLAEDLHAESDNDATAEVVLWAEALRTNCNDIVGDTNERTQTRGEMAETVRDLSQRARKLAFEMDFSLLYNTEKQLLSIGYRPDSGELDDSCYDLLASEARLASLFAIAKGDVPTAHWVRLGRPVTSLGTKGALLSWSGSMFEYLMPPLVMHERIGGLLNSANTMAVETQIRHARAVGLPWGVSESAFSARDHQMNYQYYAFGIPELALKRVVTSEYVVAPYATLLAAQIDPRAAVRNLHRLDRIGALGSHGYFDAVDFTPVRMPAGHDHVVVRNVMAHHQGMVIVSVANVVLDGIHRDRFHADPVIKAAELLLQEKAPREIVPITQAGASEPRTPEEERDTLSVTTSNAPASDSPILALLSNGRYSTLLSGTGSGPSSFGDMAVTRWRPDPTLDIGGSFLFLRDTGTGDWWSTTTSPRAAPGEQARTEFSDHKAKFHKIANGIDSVTEVIVATEVNGEGRKLTLRNTDTRRRSIEVTSYGEIVLDRAEADLAHPAFSKMFVKTAIRDNGRTITAFRNPRTPKDRVVHFAHLLAGGAGKRAVEAETDRRAFLGRGHDLDTAVAFDEGARLGGADGFTLDPIFAIRQVVKIPPGKSVSLTFWTVVAETAEELDHAIRHCRLDETFGHEDRMSWSMSQVQLRHASITPSEAALFREVGASLVWPDPRLAIQDDGMRNAVGGQSSLWPIGVSGDNPIFLLRTDDEADLEIVRKALRMADYFRLHGLSFDLVILNERKSSYAQDLQSAIGNMCDMSDRAGHVDAAHRNVHPVRRDQISDETLDTLLATARIVLHTRNGKISTQLSRLVSLVHRQDQAPPDMLPAPVTGRKVPDFPQEAFQFWNGYGGFSGDGLEYVVRMRHGERTPHPWINVIARDDFGFHVSAGGAAFTWSVNSRDYQITPWSNDPVFNRPGEAILIRNTVTGQVVSPFAALSDDPLALHEARHGLGRSTFRVWTDWVEAEVVMTLAEGVPARLSGVTVRNPGTGPLRVDVVSYAELVLGNNRERSGPMIRVARDESRNALIARNSFSTEITGRVTAMSASVPLDGTTASRRAFLGRGGSLRSPAGLTAWPEGDQSDGDPCLAARVGLVVPAGEAGSVTFVLADGSEEQIDAVLEQACAADALERALATMAADWTAFLGHLQVETPDPKLNLMVNTWLPYQALSCRIRARSAFYQASGAFGFRDQLQDTSAFILQDRSLARAQILNAASRQFPEGDFQHWWLPRTGAGVRTMISDDVVWLAHITARYVTMTGDAGILDEPLAFLNGPELEEGAHDNFFVPEVSDTTAPLYAHCARALDLAIARTGERGMPLMLGGDWNDGMNQVGEGGAGESVWLGWFLVATLDAFLPLAEARGDHDHVAAWRDHRASLLSALEDAGWDGDWYRRAYYDDGAPLGSKESDECRIDSIAQSWAAISGAGDPDRARRALDAVLGELADPADGVLRLFKPPFENTSHEPGYIKGYPPGVRENGGQYTHAASWVVHALGRSGRGTEALAMFDLLNPINHALTAEAAEVYRVEPYVVAADVYGAGPRIGRGGWTWYTGSAGWLYRSAIEGILGITLKDGRDLDISPALPDGWDGFSAEVEVAGERRKVEVRRQDDRVSVTVDGTER